jgi:ribosome-associated toxin RatA of RatAB toxin-antitoxin module
VRRKNAAVFILFVCIGCAERDRSAEARRSLPYEVMEHRRSLYARLLNISGTGVFSVMYVLGTPAAAPPAAPSPPHRVAATSGVIFASTIADTPRTESVAIAGSRLVRGRSTITIAAPIEKVRQVVLDFPNYPAFMPHYQSCRVLSQGRDGASEVYMEVVALNGAVKMWAQVNVVKTVLADGTETYETKFIKGNVKDLKALWRLKKIDDRSTEVSLEVFLLPRLPLPVAVVNKENLDGSAAAVVAVKQRAFGI